MSSGRGLGRGRGAGIGSIFFPIAGNTESVPVEGELSAEHERQIAALVLSSPPRGASTGGRSGLSSPEPEKEEPGYGNNSYKRAPFPSEETASRGRGMGRGIGVPIQFTASAVVQNVDDVETKEVAIPPLRVPTNPTSTGSKSEPAKQPEPVKEEPVVEKELVLKHGDKGSPAEFATNFINLEVTNGKGIFEYHVGFDPPIDTTALRKRALRSHNNLLGATRMFDGTTLFLPEKLPDKVTTLAGEHPANPLEQVITVLRFIKQKNEADCAHFYNIFFNRVMEILSLVQMKRNYYDIRSIHHIHQHKLEIWPGYVHSVEKQEGGLMLNLDISHKVLRKETVLDILELLRKSGAPDWKKKFEDQILNEIVLTRYNNLSYRIDDVIWELNPTSKFPRRDEEITFLDYYKNQHNITLNELNQPLLLSKIKPRKNDKCQELKTVCLVPELCSMTGLTTDHTSNFQIMKDIAQFTRVTPEQRVATTQKWLKNVDETPEAKQNLTDWGIKINMVPIHVQGRIATGPSIVFSKRLTVKEVGPDFSRESGANCYEPIALKNWVILVSNRDSELAKRLIETYKQVCGALGIPFTAGAIKPMQRTTPADYVNILKDIGKNKGEFQFVIAILPTQRDDIYGAFKKMCLTELPISSQVILAKTLRNDKRVRSIMVKVALQINCKLGGAIWALNLPIKDSLMIIGIDVHHDPTKRNPSITAMVSALNNTCTKYCSRVVVQRPHQEVVDAFQCVFKETLVEYVKINGFPPTRIVVFRDGVSNSQLDLTLKHEVTQFHTVIEEDFPQVKLFTFVVVQKRLSERFYIVKNRKCDNPPPGSIVDNTVTRPYMFDYFLISQLVRQGTVTPTHYIVLNDVGDIKPDFIQKLSYVMSFMYFNWPGTIRVPSVCQYSHKLAFLIGLHVKVEPKNEMRDRLYYL